MEWVERLSPPPLPLVKQGHVRPLPPAWETMMAQHARNFKPGSKPPPSIRDQAAFYYSASERVERALQQVQRQMEWQKVNHASGVFEREKTKDQQQQQQQSPTNGEAASTEANSTTPVQRILTFSTAAPQDPAW